MKTRSKILSTIAFFLLVVSLLATIIDVCAFDHNYYVKEYEKVSAESATGMNNEDLMNATDTLLDYLQDERDDIIVIATVNGVEREVFNERETIHMVDVKELYQNFKVVRNIAVCIGIILLVLALYFEREHKNNLLKYGYRMGSSLMIAVVVFLAIYALADFTQFWTNFHQIFFDNDYWLLNPNTSIMINMFPEDFWFDLVIKIIAIYFICMLVIGLGIYQPWKKRSKTND